MREPLVSVSRLADELGAPDVRVLHCMVGFRSGEHGGYSLPAGRGAWEAGHIPGSRPIDVVTDLSDAQSAVEMMMPPGVQVAAVMAAAGVATGDRVILYDAQMNVWAARVWWMLSSLGVEASILDGGLAAWIADHHPLETGLSEAVRPAAFSLGTPADAFASKEGVLAALDDNDTCLVDALEPAVFHGERRDYARAGHIPSAINIPFSTLVDPVTQKYLRTETLAARLAPAIAARRVIAYCGAGAAASSIALTLKRLGQDHVLVYDGSLIEWARDDALPMTTAD